MGTWLVDPPLAAYEVLEKVAPVVVQVMAFAPGPADPAFIMGSCIAGEAFPPGHAAIPFRAR